MIWYKRFIVLVFTIVVSQTFAQKRSLEIEDLKVRVQMLEDYKSNINTLADARSENLKAEVQKEVKAGVDEIEESTGILKNLVYIGLPATAGAFILGFVSLIIYARRLITKRISSIIEKKREDIIRLVETEAFDNRLRNSKKLLVISGNEESSENIRSFLSKLRFKNVIYRVVGTFDDIPDHDLMIFNNPKCELSDDTIEELIQKSDDEDHYFVAYCTERMTYYNSRLNYSNSRFTLYHSILSTLKYSEITRLIDNID